MAVCGCESGCDQVLCKEQRVVAKRSQQSLLVVAGQREGGFGARRQGKHSGGSAGGDQLRCGEG